MITFIRLCRKHIVLLLVVPIILGLLVTLLTQNMKKTYSSETVLYTGLATGSSIEMDKTFNYFLTNTAFDNLINIVNSRETQQEVAIRLLSQHLMLDGPDPKYISEKSFEDLRKIVPPYIFQMVNAARKANHTDSNRVDTSVVAEDPIFPKKINRHEFERVVAALSEYMKSSNSNFVDSLLSFDDPHYSVQAISAVKALRVGNSDLVKLSYEIDDAGICQQTLAIFNEVCIKNYKLIKENRSDEVVKYFQGQLSAAESKLRDAEGKLLEFNQAHKIINYYEQSKAVAVVREDLDVSFSAMKADLAGREAAIKRLEEKLNIQQLVQLKSNAVLEKKKELGDVQYAIAMAEVDTTSAGLGKAADLRKKAESLEREIRGSVQELYTYQNTTDGLPVNSVLNDWISNVIEAENLRAKLLVMNQRRSEFEEKYSVYAPAGANIKKIEREISVSEQGYLELLHGLNLAKLKLQDNELSSDLKAVDPPYYPLNANPTKRKILIIAAAFLGVLIVLVTLLMLEYTDSSLRNLGRASKTLGIKGLGMVPKVYMHPGVIGFTTLQDRMLGMAARNLERALSEVTKRGNAPKRVVFLSVTPKEGKSVVAANLARYFKQHGKKVLLEIQPESLSGSFGKSKHAMLKRLLGYPDPRIDTHNLFLRSPETYLDRSEWRALGNTPEAVPAGTEYILTEVPSLLQHGCPDQMIREADLCVFVCRSNRVWHEADFTALSGVTQLKPDHTCFIMNGINLEEAESLVGELPKKRSRFRIWVKRALRLQFKRDEHFSFL